MDLLVAWGSVVFHFVPNQLSWYLFAQSVFFASNPSLWTVSSFKFLRCFNDFAHTIESSIAIRGGECRGVIV